jgi:hypothetical protein
MLKTIVAAFAIGTFGALFVTGMEQPEGKGKGPKDKKGWEPGKIIPPHVRDALDLTEDQQKKIEELEKEVRSKLLKIFTDEQKQRLQELNDKGPKGPKDFDGPPDKKGKRKGPPKDDKGTEAKAEGAIQWYATWESGRREAERTGRPILLVSAAPHCAGVSGTW